MADISSGQPLVLHYFQLRARAEPLRMLLRFACIAYEDKLYSPADWKDAKATMPEGRGVPGVATRPPGNRALPVLDLPSGGRVVETSEIARTIAKLAGDLLVPTDEHKLVQAQGIWEATMNFPMYWVQPLLSSYQQEQAEAILRGETPEGTIHGNIADLPFSYSQLRGAFENWEAQLGDGPFFGGERPHYGDFAMFHAFEAYRLLDPVGSEGLTRLEAHAAHVAALPAVASYLAERPASGHGEDALGTPLAAGLPGSIYCKWVDPATRGDR